MELITDGARLRVNGLFSGKGTRNVKESFSRSISMPGDNYNEGPSHEGPLLCRLSGILA